MPTTRGTFGFDVTAAGDLGDTLANAELLRKLWLDRSLINGETLGPGDPGDFDNGAWHVGCHLAGAGGVRRRRDGRVAWLEITHDGRSDLYVASITTVVGTTVETHPIDSTQGRDLLAGSTLLGFVEGNSTGHISARGVTDPPTRFNQWVRQDFDQPVTSEAEGGKVWEHWCTLRDLRTPDPAGASVLRAYVCLCAALGDRFAPTVARGRRDYHHPRQLCALVEAGFTSEASATWDITPDPLPRAPEQLLLEARPADALKAVEQLTWGATPRYYMYQRRIGHWSAASRVRDDLRRF